jgi:hypothetical protein
MKNCPRCGRALGDAAAQCWCGFEATPQQQWRHSNAKRIVFQEATEESTQASCPKCGSVSLSANQKGYGLGKGVTGGVLLGPAGLLAGFLGSKKVTVTCLKCGHQWSP